MLQGKQVSRANGKADFAGQGCGVVACMADGGLAWRYGQMAHEQQLTHGWFLDHMAQKEQVRRKQGGHTGGCGRPIIRPGSISRNEMGQPGSPVCSWRARWGAGGARQFIGRAPPPKR